MSSVINSEQDAIKTAKLRASTDMEAVAGTVDVPIPIAELWSCFDRANEWPRWNRCFWWVRNRTLRRGEQLIWAFEPIKPQYVYKLPAAARIVELDPPNKVTWEVTIVPGMYARHTYHLTDLGNGETRFGSWEQGMGAGFRAGRWFWLPHFVFVKDRSLEGAQRLAEIYRTTGQLSSAALQEASDRTNKQGRS